MRIRIAAIALLGVALLIGACSDGGDDGDNGAAGSGNGEATAADNGGGGEGAVAIGLTEWQVTASPDEVDAGSITFDASNSGTVPHEFAVVRTDLAADALPTEAGQVDETAVEIVGRTEQINGGSSATLDLDLEAGSYVLICNIAGHYDLGMRSAFTVD